MFLIDPIPNVRIKYLRENRRIYPVLQIQGDDFGKPYFIKNSGQCFIRTGASSSPASRTTIMNLFNSLITKRHGVERLRVSLTLLKESLLHTSERIKDHHTFLPPLSLDYVRNAVLDTEWFLIQNNLLGGRIAIGHFRHGFHSFLYKIELLNMSIDAYNRTSGVRNKGDIVHEIRYWEPNREDLRNALGFIDTVCLKCTEFLSRFK